MVELPVPPEKFFVEDVHPGSICRGKICLPSGVIKIRSRYLGASVASCHDICKYGSKELNKEMRAAGEAKRKILVPSSPKPSFKRVANVGGRNLVRGTYQTKYQYVFVNNPELKKPMNGEDTGRALGIIEPIAKYKAKEPSQSGVYATLSSPANGKSSRVNRNRSLSTQLPTLSSSKKLIQSGGKISRHAQTLDCGHQSSSSTASSEHVKTAQVVNQVPYPIQVNKKRGRAVVVESHQEISTTRCKFRPGRVLKKHNSQEENSIQMSLRKKEEHGDVEANINEVEHKEVVLRHQDIDGRKDVKVLFNNVIEETASKLAEAKKSKVMALVGAFEKVISLQDIKQLEMAAC